MRNWAQPSSFLGFALLFCLCVAALPADAAPDFEGDLLAYRQLNVDQRRALAAGEVVRFQCRSRGMEGAQAFIFVPAPVPDVWKLLVDYPTFKTWMPGVKDITQVTWVSPEVAQVGYIVASPLRDLSYRLERTHRAEERIRWRRLSGDLESLYGGYDLQPHAGGTMLRYWSLIDIGFPVPAGVRDFFSGRELQRLMMSIRDEAVRRYPPRSGKR